MQDGQRKAGIVAVVGRTNVGKSTLVNRIAGEKVSIVSAAAQTTRNPIRAVLTDARGQLVLLDTPGVHRAESQLGTLMNRMARAATEGVDAVLFVMDMSVPPREEDRGWMERLARLTTPGLFVLNKLDAAGQHAARYRDAWAAVATGRADAPAPIWREVSAQIGTGVEDLVQTAFDVMPVGEPLFDADLLTDYPVKLAIGDIIREKLAASLRDEMPHAIAVQVEEWERRPDGGHVQATVYVNRASQKGIVIGHKGRVLRNVKRRSEVELAAMFDIPVVVDLWVKVEKNWQENYWILRQLGHAG